MAFRDIGSSIRRLPAIKFLGITVVSGKTLLMEATDAERRRLVIPLIRAEMKRRALVKAQAEVAAEIQAGTVTPTTEEVMACGR
jgi:hypothetical protein